MFVSETLWNECDFNFYFVMIECYNQGKYQVLIVYIYKLYTDTLIIYTCTPREAYTGNCMC